MLIEAVILAAGFSSRAKSYKMTLKVREKTVIERAIESMLNVSSRVIVVGGYKIEKLKPIINRYKNVELIFNENFQEGMFSSVKKGFSHIKGDSFFFMPGDYPLIDDKVCLKLLKHRENEIVIPTYNGKKGHPILMKSYLAKELLQSSKYSNLREFINTKKPIFIPVENEGILLDIDTMEDYKRILALS
ncbi:MULTISPECIES: nucleotidyltransferase family protein [Clostridium]|uniref:Molybdenum cofactor cytidylyltransferase n=2 Tax=Clostridium TaxID=1485 RepID=A0A151AMR0_9CLOT|nr:MULTISPECIES: nucleotidyltransferase family protein [Clostridium]KYH28919.1 molybdenum cofactor cytidylyltransferase [Clostridium colicanis DSM 13634]MBE6044882.1 nucleotidyltransferase family protein [Clostridium thermopalmarium]PRR73185.1 Molybdenum cofactor cytidylyltransferase [Clostridium thermopalmarium DSM 5974]PVZ25250.1 molybdenum cofactor cytidylyltransferase [Clostridium thermopalmarium DSM 5974]